MRGPPPPPAVRPQRAPIFLALLALASADYLQFSTYPDAACSQKLRTKTQDRSCENTFGANQVPSGSRSLSCVNGTAFTYKIFTGPDCVGDPTFSPVETLPVRGCALSFFPPFFYQTAVCVSAPYVYYQPPMTASATTVNFLSSTDCSGQMGGPGQNTTEIYVPLGNCVGDVYARGSVIALVSDMMLNVNVYNTSGSCSGTPSEVSVEAIGCSSKPGSSTSRLTSLSTGGGNGGGGVPSPSPMPMPSPPPGVIDFTYTYGNRTLYSDSQCTSVAKESSGIPLNHCLPYYSDTGAAEGSQQAILVKNSDGTYTVSMFAYPAGGAACTQGSTSGGVYTGDSTSGCVSADIAASGPCISTTSYDPGSNTPITVWARCVLTNGPVPSHGPNTAPTAGTTSMPKPSPPPGVIDFTFTYGNRTLYSDSQCTSVTQGSQGIPLNQCFPSYSDTGAAQGSQQAILMKNGDGTYTVAMVSYPTGASCSAGSTSGGSFTGDSTSGCVSADSATPGKCASLTMYAPGESNVQQTVWMRCMLTNAPATSWGPTAGTTTAPSGVVASGFILGNRTLYSDSQCMSVVQESSGIPLSQCLTSFGSSDAVAAQGSQQAIPFISSDGTYTVAIFAYPAGTACSAGSPLGGFFTGDSTSGCVSADSATPGKCASMTMYAPGGSDGPMARWTRCVLTKALASPLPTPSTTATPFPTRSAYPSLPGKSKSPAAAASRDASVATNSPSPSPLPPAVSAAMNATIVFTGANTSELADRNFFCEMQAKLASLFAAATSSGGGGKYDFSVVISSIIDAARKVRYFLDVAADVDPCANYVAPTSAYTGGRSALATLAAGVTATTQSVGDKNDGASAVGVRSASSVASSSSSSAAAASDNEQSRALQATGSCTAATAPRDPAFQCTPLTAEEQTKYASTSGTILDVSVSTTALIPTSSSSSSDSSSADFTSSLGAALTAANAIVAAQIATGELNDAVAHQAGVPTSAISASAVVTAPSLSAPPAANPGASAGASSSVLGAAVGGAVGGIVLIAAVGIAIWRFTSQRPGTAAGGVIASKAPNAPYPEGRNNPVSVHPRMSTTAPVVAGGASSSTAAQYMKQSGSARALFGPKIVGHGAKAEAIY